MTKTLLLMRHAKSSWKDEALGDHDRPLNKRGQHDAPRMGQLMCEESLLPELVVSSTAERARATSALVAEAAGYDGEVLLTADLYHAGATDIVAVVHRLDDRYRSVLLVGHNPGMVDLLERLTGGGQHFPTAALAQLRLRVTHWHDVGLNTAATLIGFWQPRDLT